MQYLRWDKANVVGVSMGGGIAAAFTDQFPHLVDEGVGLIASAGLMEVRWSKLSFCVLLILSYSRVKFLARPNSCLHLLSKLWLQAGLSACVFSFSILISCLTLKFLSFHKSYIQRLTNKNVPEQNVNDDIIEVMYRFLPLACFYQPV
jgi:pimeloyl-ACP methyl ester carboxylesterase